MSIRHWPGAERPRERLLERGAHVLSDAELLALLLGSGTRGRNAVELARALLAHFGSLRDLLNAEAPRCLGQTGIGPARYAILQAAHGAGTAAFSRSAAGGAGAGGAGCDAHVPASRSCATGLTRCSAACTWTTGTG